MSRLEVIFNLKSRFLISGLLTLSFFERCQTKTSVDKHRQTAVAPITKSITRLDTIIQKLKSNGEITKNDILTLGVIDTSHIHASSAEESYCDTTVQLNDSIFYSIIKLSDAGGNCSHSFIVTFNEKGKKAIASEYLEPDCDIDYSWDSYELFDYKIVSKDSIRLIKTTTFQKRNRISDNEEENIDHKQTEKSYFVIHPTGQIKISNQ